MYSTLSSKVFEVEKYRENVLVIDCCCEKMRPLLCSIPSIARHQASFRPSWSFKFYFNTIVIIVPHNTTVWLSLFSRFKIFHSYWHSLSILLVNIFGTPFTNRSCWNRRVSVIKGRGITRAIWEKGPLIFSLSFIKFLNFSSCEETGKWEEVHLRVRT